MLQTSPSNNQLVQAQLLQPFLSHVPIAIAMLDCNMQYLFTSQQWLTDCGLEGVNLTEKSYLDTVSHSSGEWQLLYQRCLTEKIELSREEFTQIRATATGWLKWQITPWQDASGAVAGLVVLRADITEQKRAETKAGICETNNLEIVEAALAESEAKFRRIVESANDLIYMIGLDGGFTYLSPQFKEMWGYELADFQGKSFAEIVHPDDMASVINSAQHVMKTGKRDSGLEFRTQRSDGSWCWIVCNSSPIIDATGNVIGLQGIARDVSDRKIVEDALRRSEVEIRQKAEDLERTVQELRRTQAQLVQSEKMSSLGQLVAGVAHEINNPVNFIYGNISHADDYIQDLLRLVGLYQTHYSTPIPEIQAEIEAIDLDFLVEDLIKLLASMKIGADRIRQIVLSLRTFSRMDEADLKAVDIHEGLDSTLMILEHRLKEKAGYPPIQIVKHYANLPPVECYAGQLNQVFMNLLVNALDALEERDNQRTAEQAKQMPSQIQIQTVVNDKNIQIHIADNGHGIPEALQRRLFDPFFTTKPIGKGTGMGLSISYQIITERHGGSLQCHSISGAGAEFIISIPIKHPLLT